MSTKNEPTTQNRKTNKRKNRKKLLLVLDVDGVCRTDVLSACENFVSAQLNKIFNLMQESEKAKKLFQDVHFACLSGTQSHDLSHLKHEYAVPNFPLSRVFNECFSPKLFEGEKPKLQIRGQLGSDESSPTAASATSPTATLEGKQLQRLPKDLRLNLIEVLCSGTLSWLLDTENLDQKEFDEASSILSGILSEFRNSEEKQSAFSNFTPEDFTPFVEFINKTCKCDPSFRLISHETSAEIGVAPTRKAVDLRIESLKILDNVNHLCKNHKDARVRDLAAVGHCSGGVAHKNATEFIWCTITMSDKGMAVKEMLKKLFGENEQNKEEDPVAFMMVGDSMVDFCAHACAKGRGAAFHVGPPSTLERIQREDREQAAAEKKSQDSSSSSSSSSSSLKYDHVRFVSLADCKEAQKVKGEGSSRAHNDKLFGTTDVQSLTTGTLEILLRLENKFRSILDNDNEEEEENVDFKNILEEVRDSFKGGVEKKQDEKEQQQEGKQKEKESACC